MSDRNERMYVASDALLASLRHKVEIYEKALDKIAKSTKCVEGDYTFNQMYKAPTGESYIAKEALREANNMLPVSGAMPNTETSDAPRNTEEQLVGATFEHPDLKVSFCVSEIRSGGLPFVNGPYAVMVRTEFVPIDKLLSRWIRNTEMDELNASAQTLSEAK